MSRLKGTYKEIIDIALPLMLGNMAWALIGITDQAFMGHFGKTEEAAIGPVSIFYSILFMVGFGYTRGIQIMIARSCGEGDKKQVGKIFDNTLYVVAITSVVLSVLIFLVKGFFLNLLLHDKNIIQACQDFLDYRIWGVPASFVSCLFIAFYSGIGKTKLLSFSVAMMAIVNIALNYVFVFGKFGFPEMGIKGSGLASSIAEWVSLVILISGLFIRKYHHEFHLFHSKLEAKLVYVMTKKSTPLVLQSLIANAGWFVFFTFVEKLGQNQLALSNILRQIIMWIGIPIWALGSVTNTVVSNLTGQKRLDEVYPTLKRINWISFGATFIQCALLIILHLPILKIFTADTVIYDTALYPILVVCVALLIMSISNTFFNGLVSTSGTRYALYIEGLSMLLYMFYVYFLFHLPNLTLSLAWTTEWIYWSVILLAALWKLKQTKIIQ